MSVTLPPDALAARYRLLCRVTSGTPVAEASAIHHGLDVLQQLIRQDLMALAQHGAPADFSQIVAALEEAWAQLQLLCALPMLAGRKPIGFGGAFSAGKSSLINALIGQPLLAVEIDPTTSLPTYLLQEQQSAILAVNRTMQRVELDQAEFISLTHGEQQAYGSNAGALLHSALYCVPQLPWSELALTDVPGYSKPDGDMLKARSDARIAHEHLSAAQALVWVVSVEAGVISEEDLVFLASLPRELACLIVVSRADKREPEAVAAVVEGIRRAVAARGLTVLDVVPVSTRDSHTYPLSAVREQLQRWNKELPAIRPTERFKRQFFRYERYLAQEIEHRSGQLGQINRILVLSTDNEVQQHAAALRGEMQNALERAIWQTAELKQFQQRFFAQLHALVQASGMTACSHAYAAPASSGQLDLLSLLRKLHAPDDGGHMQRRHLAVFSRPADAIGLPSLMRRTSQRFLPVLQCYSADAEASRAARLLRQRSNPALVRILSF